MKNILRRLKLAGILSTSQEKSENPTISSFNSIPQAGIETKNDNFTATSRSFNRKIKKFIKNSAFIPFAIILLLVILIGYYSIKTLTNTQPSSTLGIDDQRIEIQKPKSQQQLNRQFLFPLKGTDGKEVSKLKFSLQNSELRDEIIIKGQKATAVQGRTFLILNLKITNDYNKAIQINARDYLRLQVNNSSEKLAPDIHNDPVEIQAISTKYTRLGFPINDIDKNLLLQVGEITSGKEYIKLDLK